MPELPEVETVKRGIAPLLEGQILKSVISRRERLRIPLPEHFMQRMQGRKVTHISRRAKYLLWHLDKGETMICHLGMSGKITMKASADREDQENFAKHDHVIFETNRGDLLIYNDPRRFGLITLCATDQLDQHRFFCEMGPEPLSNEFHGAGLYEKIKNRRTSLKNILLDQRVVVGLGNIYVCEALFLAGISPKKMPGDLPQDQLENLVPIIRDVLRRAIEAGGSSLKDYAHVDGELGYFQHHFKVYGREGEGCITPGCNHEIERIIQSGRSTFYCPSCQF